MAYGLDQASLLIHKALFHLEAGVAHLGDDRLALQVIVETDGHLEVHLDMHKDIFEGEPIDGGLEGVLEEAASSHVEVMALRPVVDVVIRVEVAHSDLYRTGKHIIL